MTAGCDLGGMVGIHIQPLRWLVGSKRPGDVRDAFAWGRRSRMQEATFALNRQ